MTDPKLRPLLQALLGVLLATALSGVAGMVAQRRSASDLLARSVEESARVAAADLPDAVYRLDVRAIRMRLAHLRQNVSFQRLYVTDATGTILSDGKEENSHRDERLSDVFTRELLRAKRFRSTREGGVLDVGVPIAWADGSTVGFLLMRVSEDALGGMGTSSLPLLAALFCFLLGSAIVWRSWRSLLMQAPASTSEAEQMDDVMQATATEVDLPVPQVTGESGIGIGVLEHVLQASGDASLLVDATGTIRSANQAAVGLTGGEAVEVVGRSLKAVLGKEGGDIEDLARRTALSPVPCNWIRTDGGKQPVSLSSVVVRSADGRLDHLVCVVRRQGGGKATEDAELRRLREEAQRELDWVRAEREKLEQEAAASATQGEPQREEIARLTAALASGEKRLVDAEEARARVTAELEEARRRQGEAESAAENARLDAEKLRAEAETNKETAEDETGAAVSRLQSELEEARRGQWDAAARVEELRKELNRLRAVQVPSAQPGPSEDAGQQRLKAGHEELEGAVRELQAERDELTQELERTRRYWKEQEHAWNGRRGEDAKAQAAGVSSESAGKLDQGTVLDRDEALKNVDGDFDFLKALIDVFMESSARQLLEIHEAVKQKDARGIERTARLLKGVVATFGARAAATAALQLETVGIVGDMDRAPAAFEVLDAELERLKPELVKLATGGKPEAK